MKDAKIQVRDHSKLTFFSCLASSLLAHGCITPLQGDCIKQGLLKASEDRKNFLRILFQECNGLLTEVFPLIPERQLFSMMHRFRLQGVAEKISDTLTHNAQQLITKTKLFFNRPFYLENKDQPTTQTLMSVLILEIAEHMEEIFELSKRFQILLSSYPAGSTSQFTATLASHLNMVTPKHCLPPFYEENEFSHQLAHIFESLCRLLVVSHRTVTPHFTTSEFSTKNIYPSEIQGQCYRLRNNFINPSETFTQWHLQSDLIVELSYEVLNNLNDLAESFISVLNPSNFMSTPDRSSFITQSILIAAQSAGMSPSTALEALRALEVYCRKEGINLSEVTSIELPKISPKLSSSLLKQVQEIDKDSSMNQMQSSEKDKIWQRSKKITQTFGFSL